MKKFPEALRKVVFDRYFTDKLKRQPIPSSHLSFWHFSCTEAHNEFLYVPTQVCIYPPHWQARGCDICTISVQAKTAVDPAVKGPFPTRRSPGLPPSQTPPTPSPLPVFFEDTALTVLTSGPSMTRPQYDGHFPPPLSYSHCVFIKLVGISLYFFHPSPKPLPLVTISVCSESMGLFLFCFLYSLVLF